MKKNDIRHEGMRIGGEKILTEKVIEVKLNSEEKKMFVKSVKSVKNLINIVKKIKTNI